MTDNSERKRGSVRDLAIFALVAVFIVAIWLFFWFFIDRNIVSVTPRLASSEELRGLFGDSFGAINSLFSGLAFAGIIVTIIMQSRELREQRDELERSRNSTERQLASAVKEKFESTFFKLVEMHADITAKLQTPTGISGRQAHGYFFEQFVSKDREFDVYRVLQKLSHDEIRRIQSEEAVSEGRYPQLSTADISTLSDALEKLPQAFDSYLDPNKPHHKEKVKYAYQKACEDYLDYFAHYFRNLYHLIKYVDDSSDVSEEDKKLYTRLIRAQLSDVELVSLFYNSFCHYDVPGRSMELGYPKMKHLLQKFDILQHMSERHLLHKVHMEIFRQDVI